MNDDFIIGLVKGKIGEVIDRMDHERPELSQQDREKATVRLSRHAVGLTAGFGEALRRHGCRAFLAGSCKPGAFPSVVLKRRDAAQ